MALLDRDIAQVLAEPGKQLVGDLVWHVDDAEVGSHVFVAKLVVLGHPLVVRGQLCLAVGALRFAAVLGGVGRIAALDRGHEHIAPTGERTGPVHLHRWTPGQRDRLASPLPTLLEAPLATVWASFCEHLQIFHTGILHDPPPVQEALL